MPPKIVTFIQDDVGNTNTGLAKLSFTWFLSDISRTNIPFIWNSCIFVFVLFCFVHSTFTDASPDSSGMAQHGPHNCLCTFHADR